MQTVVRISADSAVPTALANLRQVLGDEAVITAPAELAFYSQDVYRSGQLPVAVIRPKSTEQLSAALRAIAPWFASM